MFLFLTRLEITDNRNPIIHFARTAFSTQEKWSLNIRILYFIRNFISLGIEKGRQVIVYNS